MTLMVTDAVLSAAVRRLQTEIATRVRQRRAVTDGLAADLAALEGATQGAVVNGHLMQNFAARVAMGQHITVAYVGDSLATALGLGNGALRNHFNTAMGIAAPGWVSVHSLNAVPYLVTRTRTGAWTEDKASPTAIGPNNSHATTMDLTATLLLSTTGTVTAYVIHYLRQPGGARFRWRIGAGAWTGVSTGGVLAYMTLTVPGGGDLEIDIEAVGTAGLTIAGVDIRNDTAGKVTFQKLGSGGATAADYAAMPAAHLTAAYASILPDVVMVMLGINDLFALATPAAVVANVLDLVTTLRAVNPLCDVVLIGPPPVNSGSAAVIDDINLALRDLAVSEDFTFVNLRDHFGTRAQAVARGLADDIASTRHPTAEGGDLIGDVLFEALFAPWLRPDATPFAASLMNDASAGAMRATLGLGTLATEDGSWFGDRLQSVLPLTTDYVMTTIGTGGGATAILAGVNDAFDLFPFTPATDLTTAQVAVYVTTGIAGQQGKIVIYGTDAAGRPDALIWESPAVGFGSTGQKTTALAMTFTAGRLYWIGIRHNGMATLAAWPTGATPDIAGPAPSVNIQTTLRRSLTFATAAPASWGYSATEITANPAPAIWLRAA